MKNIRKYEIINVSIFLFVSLFVLNAVYAQDYRLAPIDDSVKVLEDVSLVKEESKLDTSPTEKTIEETKENLKSIAETVEEVRVEAEKAEDEVRAQVKKGIDRNIIDIRKRMDTPSFELQKAVDVSRVDLFDSVSRTLKNINVTNADTLESFSNTVESKVSNIERVLEEKTGLEANFDQERRSIKNTLLKLQGEINQRKELIQNRDGEKVYEDTDGDGISDYDEKFIYNTDPEQASTSGDEESDSDKILSGINPATGQKIEFQDPREDSESFVTQAYKLETVSIIKQNEKKSLRFEGRALPNSFITLYIYSTPIIVTIKTDKNGDWNYELDKELEDGEHKMYVATVNNSGKIIARSDAVSFTKTAEAASIGIVGLDIEAAQTGGFLKDNLILISLAILIAIVVLALMVIGGRSNAKDVLADLKKEIDDSK